MHTFFSKKLEVRSECFIRLGPSLCVDITDASATNLDDCGSDDMIKAIVNSFSHQGILWACEWIELCDL